MKIIKQGGNAKPQFNLRKRCNNMTEYKTLEAQQSAVKIITGCIDAINSEKGLPYQLGTLTVDYITKYLAEYRKLIEKDIKESQKVAEAAGFIELY